MSDSNSDVPIVMTPDGWRFALSPGQTVQIGNVFRCEYGFRVSLAFQESSKFQGVDVGTAREIAAMMRTYYPDYRDAMAIAERLEMEAERCERLNAGWAAIGRPADGFDSQSWGQA